MPVAHILADEITTPDTPATNYRGLYPKSDGWYDIDDTGTETALGGGSTLSYARLRDEKATGTDGGGSSAAAWNNRDLNTEVTDADNIVSISSNQFTPISGDYVAWIKAPAFDVGRNRIRLYNVTQTSVVDEGSSEVAGTTNGGASATLFVKFTANGTDAYRVDHYTTSAIASTGLGFNTGDGSAEVYLSILLIKI